MQPGHPMREAWFALMDELIELDPTGSEGRVYVTKHGAMTASEIGRVGGVIRYEPDGAWHISFPPPEPKPERTPTRGW
jgi:hypothetical protein